MTCNQNKRVLEYIAVKAEEMKEIALKHEDPAPKSNKGGCCSWSHRRGNTCDYCGKWIGYVISPGVLCTVSTKCGF